MRGVPHLEEGRTSVKLSFDGDIGRGELLPILFNDACGVMGSPFGRLVVGDPMRSRFNSGSGVRNDVTGEGGAFGNEGDGRPDLTEPEPIRAGCEGEVGR